VRKELLSALVAATSLFGSATASMAETIVISQWESYMDPELVDKFTKETGINVEFQVHASNDEIVGKLAASQGKGYDVVFVSQMYVEVLQKMGLLAELDHNQIPNLKLLYPEAFDLSYDPGLKYSVPFTWGVTGICYRSDKVAKPESWKDIVEPSDEVKGRFTLLGEDRWLLAAGLKALGYSLNETDPDKLNEARDLLISAKKDMVAYDNQTMHTRLITGEVVMAHSWDGWCNYATAANPDIKFSVPKEGTDTWTDTMVILGSSEHLEAAHKFVNFVLRSDNLKWTAENILFQVPNREVMDSLPALQEQFETLRPQPEAYAKNEMMHDLGEDQKTIARIVSEIKAAQ